MRCMVVRCSQSFCCYSSFLSHLSRKHRGIDFGHEARIMALLHSFLIQEEANSEQTQSDIVTPMYQEEALMNKITEDPLLSVD